jgi:UDP-N-acetylmuramate dehydrogenase
VLDETSGLNCRYIVGRSSNLLFPDDASQLYIVFTEKLSEIKKVSEKEIFAMCGANLTSLCNFAKKNSLSGLEFAFGIPGSVGGGVYMNAGAYGGEMSSVLKEIEVYDTDKKEFYTIDASDCNFSYRHSLFMERKELVVTGALFSLSEGNENEIDAVCKAHMQARKDKQPLEYPSCGSAFKRPEGHFAGKLIEDCGLKGFTIGGAQISEKHAGFVINRGGATSKDVRDLLDKTAELVYEKFEVTLCPEIEIIEEPQK